MTFFFFNLQKNSAIDDHHAQKKYQSEKKHGKLLLSSRVPDSYAGCWRGWEDDYFIPSEEERGRPHDRDGRIHDGNGPLWRPGILCMGPWRPGQDPSALAALF